MLHNIKKDKTVYRLFLVNCYLLENILSETEADRDRSIPLHGRFSGLLKGPAVHSDG